MLANLVNSLIKHGRITTTLAKAKAARPVAEKLVTLGKIGTVHARRLALARLPESESVRLLFSGIASANKERKGGYTRIIRLVNDRRGDAGQQAILEWVATPADSSAPVSSGTSSEASSNAPQL